MLFGTVLRSSACFGLWSDSDGCDTCFSSRGRNDGALQPEDIPTHCEHGCWLAPASRQRGAGVSVFRKSQGYSFRQIESQAMFFQNGKPL